MPCNGYNHPPGCKCGWGGVWHGNVPYGGGGGTPTVGGFSRGPAPPPATPFPRRVSADPLKAITIPNASCPVCGQSVFYYENEHGSRVFFDALGPPWPKHPCTDNPRRRQEFSGRKILGPRSSSPVPRMQWASEAWVPVLCESAGLIAERLHVRCRELVSGREWVIELPDEGPELWLNVIYMRRKDDTFVDISGLGDDGPWNAVGRLKKLNNIRLSGFAEYVRREREIYRQIAVKRELQQLNERVRRHRKRFSDYRFPMIDTHTHLERGYDV